MVIAETRTYSLGKYVIRQQPRFDSAYWAQYLVFLDGKLIGKGFSVPCLSDCQWMERTNGAYATQSAQPKKGILRGVAKIPKPRVLLPEIPEPA